MANRHIPKNIVEAWDAHEYLIRCKLEELDHITRLMYRDMALARAPAEQIREFIPMAFAELWDRVAEEQEAQNGRKMAQ